MFKPLLLLIFAPPSPDGGTGRRARLKIWLSQGSAGSIPVLGTKARVSVSLSTNALLWPFLHTQTHTHTFFTWLIVLTFLVWTFFHAHNQTHAAFLYAPRRSNWIIWDNPVLGVVILEGFSNRL